MGAAFEQGLKRWRRKIVKPQNMLFNLELEHGSVEFQESWIRASAAGLLEFFVCRELM